MPYNSNPIIRYEGGDAPGDPYTQGPGPKDNDNQTDPVDPFANPVVTGPETHVQEQYRDGSMSTPPTTDPYDFSGLLDNRAAEDALRQSLAGKGYDAARIEEIIGLIGPAESGTIKAGKAQTSSAPPPPTIGKQTLGGLLADGSGIAIGNTDPTQRTVQDNELVATQMEGLLDSNSAYMRNAKINAINLANARGQLGSSFAVGAAQKAAIEAALPIATADAQAYRDAATQNLNALNEFGLANLQRATALDTALLDANTRTSIANQDAKVKTNLANLDAEVRISMANLEAMTSTNIANLDAQTKTTIANLNAQTQLRLGQLQAEIQVSMQERSFEHDAAIAIFNQDGRMDLAMVDANVRALLQQAGFSHDFNMNNLDHEQQLMVNDIVNGYNKEQQARDHSLQRGLQYSNMMSQAQMNYVNYLTAYANADLDNYAAGRLQADAWNNLLAEASLINALFPEQDPIMPQQSVNTNAGQNAGNNQFYG